MYSSFIKHPDIADGNIPAADLVRVGMVAAQIIIVVFSFFFIAYSNSAFLQVRQKEFGLLSLFGMTNRQLRTLIYVEQTLLSVLAIGTGIAIGLLFSKLFLMLMNLLLAVDAPMSYQIVPGAFLDTIILFLILFQTLTILGLFRLKSRRIIELIRASKKPKSMPIYSKWLTILSIITLVSGYTLAVTANLVSAVFLVIPIVIFVLIGTYFLFTQGMLSLFKRLYARKTDLFKGTILLTRTNILFRLKDHARMLFLTSIISAVLLTAAGTVFMFFQVFIDQGTKIVPQAIAWVEQDATQSQVIEPDTVEAILDEYDEIVDYQVDTLALSGSISLPSSVPFGDSDFEENSVFLVSESDYNQVAKFKSLQTVSLSKDEVFLNSPLSMTAMIDQSNKSQQLIVKENEYTVDIVGEEMDGAIFSSTVDMSAILVLNNRFYESLAEEFEDNEMARILGYELVDWKDSIEASNEIKEQTNPDLSSSLQTRAPEYQMIFQASAVTIFIGVFISLLFFIVQGSMIYLKLFTEIEDTKQQLFALHRIGITKKESAKIINRQVQFLFFIPFVVGSIHAAFAYAMLGSILNINLFGSSLMIISIYFVFQVVYYLITKYLYQRTLLSK